MSCHIASFVNLHTVADTVKEDSALVELLNELAEAYGARSNIDLLDETDVELTPEAEAFLAKIAREARKL